MTCGYNASGHSSLLSIEKCLRHENKVINRILLNVGDGTQRFCQEHRIKLSSVSTIIITSLAPHNISGFPGMFLALSDLGIGELKVFGPQGLKAYLQCMTPFINRKYPELQVVEVEDEQQVKVKGALLSFLPVRAAEADKVIAICASVTALDDQSFHFGDDCTGRATAVLPCAHYFPTVPSVQDMVQWAAKGSLPPILLFSPLSCASFDAGAPEVVDGSAGPGERFQELIDLCNSSQAIGVLFPNTLSSSASDFACGQALLHRMHSLFPPLFPRPLPLPSAQGAAMSLDIGLHYARAVDITVEDLSMVPYVDLADAAADQAKASAQIRSCTQTSSTPSSSQHMDIPSPTMECSLPSPLSSGRRDNRRAAANLFSTLAAKRKQPSSSSAVSTPTDVPSSSSMCLDWATPVDEAEPMRMAVTRQGSSDGEGSMPCKTARTCSTDAVLPDKVPLLVQLISVPPPSPLDGFDVSFLGTGCATPSKHRNNSAILLHLMNNGGARRKRIMPRPPSPPPVPAMASDSRKRPLSLSIATDCSSSSSLCIDTSFAAMQAVDVDSMLLPDDCYMLLDCGECAAAQLFQSVQGDLQRYDALLLKIRVIWISHHHADHSTGLPALLEAIYCAQLRQKQQEQRAHCVTTSAVPRNTPPSFWNKYSLRQHSDVIAYEDDKVMLIASEGVLKYMEFAMTVAGLHELVSYYPITHTLYAGCTTDICRASHGLVNRLQSIAVQHCAGAFGLVLELANGQKVVYSGDCRPSASLVKAGMQADLLIHEATFDDDRCGDAIKKRHSTSSEALDIAARMQARLTVLTHFSQRYPLSHAWQKPATRVAVAYDLLHFSFPSQAMALPEATAGIAAAFKAMEGSEVEDSAADMVDYDE